MKFLKNHWKIILISLYSIVITIILGSYIFHAQTTLTLQIEKLANAQNTIKSLSSKLNELANTSEKTKILIPALQSEISDLKNHVSAFAKQAATCVTIKKQLNIKE